MKRREFFKSASVAAVSLAGFGSGQLFAEPAKKPNILFIIADDLGWTDLNCFGSDFYETPNIDALCEKGMKFTDAYAAAPVCSPTRASIMTGKYPARLNTTEWFAAPGGEVPIENYRWAVNKPLRTASFKEFLPLDEVTVAEALKQGGYSTFFAGKWHLGAKEKFWPENQGFDINKGGWEVGAPKGDGYFPPYDNPRLEDGPEGEHLPNRLADETVQFIKDNKDKPFLAYLSFYSVHTPLMAREDLKEKYEKKRKELGLKTEYVRDNNRHVRLTHDHAVYAGMVEAMDMACGKVLNKLKELNIEDNTIVFFMSDNGGLSTAKWHPTSNIPLRGGKGWTYEGGIREPMIIKWPGVAKQGSVCSEPVISNDFYPTMLEMAGLPLKPDQHKDGKSLVPLLKDKKMDRGPLFWHYPHYSPQGCRPSSVIRDGKWKLILWYEDNRKELFNLREDIGEKNNIADKKPEITDRLFNKLLNWFKEVDAEMPQLNPGYKQK
ncbi:Arylsulfatase [Sedimentisphaera cyanobacteriorum]|uniref:Arylsulfatase n=1 Tax=Sedimentisphaera cyanobacteriorum TaxID=1940790 RepID=A0A1Q2HSH0_9BACT|nr:sulfatase [Sedimentisphaera cyanobacteriorum]AQQ10392.1 Arylsulfatase [Sedimentisphaera cyanobacteriorum]